MPLFQYQAIDDASRRQAGRVEQPSLSAAIAQLEAQGLTILSISQEIDGPGAPQAGVVAGSDGLTAAIGRVIDRRGELEPALRAYAAELPAGRRRRELERVLALIAAGDPLAARDTFVALPWPWCPLLAAARAAEGPAEMLARFVEDSRQASEIRTLSWWRWAYPVAVSALAIGVLVLICLAIVPTFRDIFDSFGLQLPAITKLLLEIECWISSGRALMAAAVAAALLLVLRALYRGAPGRLTARLEWFAPFRLGRRLALGRLAQFTADLREAGLGTPEALRLAGAATGRRSLAYATSGGGNDPSLLSHSVSHAVAGGLSLEAQVALLREISGCHADRDRLKSGWAYGLAGPVSVVAVGLLVGFTILALFAPLFMLIEGLT